MTTKQTTKNVIKNTGSTNQKLKEVFKQAIQEYFDESGINQILVTLYESRTRIPSQQTRKVKNLLQSNSKVRSVQDWMKDSGLAEEPVMLPESRNKTNTITPNLTSVINQYNDPVASGQSILDDFENLPDFLAKGLSKITKR